MRIGELAQAAGTTAKTLRFYEDQGLLLPAARTGSGYRDYGTEIFARLDFIHRGQAAGLTLAQIRQILQIRDTGTAPCEHVRELLDMRLAEVDEQIAELGRLRQTIAGLRTAAEQVEPETCQADAVCAYL
ncbi:heavy metal-responsive transcriptional regulator [Skermania piniformis]|uniref:Heavy metal-responsive transcriptional regulator n=1 Tax=Skermania pinensis TaxID=39122 RepID=A0ABX8S7A8_9ACTN|nr:heavy metal-responsive transcriptional regulator [Skermania piniformis]QXQ12902.1 heavy metal-responsive transcriptional regulator [Skermania piniformis]